jgi:hypothetical protein
MAYNDLRAAAASAHYRQGENWCHQMSELLGSLGMSSVWDRGSYNYAVLNFKKFSQNLSEKLARADILAAEKSKTIPHYTDLIKGDYGKKFYLTRILPRDCVTTIAQLRLSRNQVLIGKEWINLGEFKIVPCKYCGDTLSLQHVLFTCPNAQRFRNNFVIRCLASEGTLPCDPELLVNEICTKLYSVDVYKALHSFVCASVKSYGTNNSN